MNYPIPIVLLLARKMLTRNVFGKKSIFQELIQIYFSGSYRHIELSSTVSATKYVFTTTKYGLMTQGKIGFNTLQVRSWI